MGPFDISFPITADGAITVVPTGGHTPHHLSVVVTTGGKRYFLAGDTSYSQEALLQQEADGVSPDPLAAKRTQSRILALASGSPLVYLPSHDPDAAKRLEQDEAIPGANAAGALMTHHSARQGGWN
jgi:glyoxylase-like metal-dependent hydrolase (beta-lactamase superfamily II)